MKIPKPGDVAGDAWGGLAAMLVALPSAIAFGVAIFSPLGGAGAAYGALAGILGTAALGFIAPPFGGTNRLITAPSAPAAAVLSVLVIELVQKGVAVDSVLLMLTVIGLICGVLQVAIGAVGLGRLIKYMPYPVVSGYLTGVGLTIIASQVPKFVGAPKGVYFWQVVSSPSLWHWQPIVVGAVTIAVMVGAARVTKTIPAAILGVAAGVIVYFTIGVADHRLWSLAGNALVIGPLAGSNAGFVGATIGRFRGVGGLGLAELSAVLGPALTLTVLLSIDTLKTCVVLDTITRSRHDSNRELIGQGLGNIVAAAVGGMPGSGQMGATLVNLSSGGQSRLSGFLEGVFALAAFLVLGTFIAWVPVAALAGILIVVGIRMFDRSSLHFLKSRSTILDFAVIAAVVVTALTVSLIAASATGVALAILLFIREQIGGNVVRHKSYGNQMFSKRMRLPSEMEILKERGDRTAIFELQGSLFFGTTDQLYSALEPELKSRSHVILDLRLVQSVDVTAAHMLAQAEDMLAERKALLLFSHIPQRVASGQDMQQYFDEVGLVRSESKARVFDELDDALEWVEDRVLADAGQEREPERPLELSEIDLFTGRKAETLAALEATMSRRAYKAGERIFHRGDADDDLYLIRRGSVRIMLPVSHHQAHHIGTFGRGDFFGEMAFLDHDTRSADAIAFTDAELYVLSREHFDAFAQEHRVAALNLLDGLARGLAVRLRYTNAELRALQG